VVDVFLGRQAKTDSPAYTVLSSREREVLQLLAEGRSSKDISQLLGIGLSTVESHRRQLKTKLHIKHFAGLVKFAIREGLTSID
jgi:DNA-binding CsgD family transcriptional regulator